MSLRAIKRFFTRISDYVDREPVFVRSIYAGSLLEDFFVSAVGAVLAIRLYLFATGYGQLTIGSLHIAHLVWGGLFMLAALVIVLGTLNRRAEALAAVIGGIGFGAFIDELGKFITKENDYFFQPTVALIYVIFVAIYLIIHSIGRRRPLSPQQSTANVFDIAMQGNLAGLDREQRDTALELIGNCPPGPTRDSLESIIRSMKLTRTSQWRLIDEVHELIDRFYEKYSPKWWFGGLIVVFFALTSITSLYAVIGVVEWSLGLALWLGAGLLLLVGLVWSRRWGKGYINVAVSAAIVIVSILIFWAALVNLKESPLSLVDYAQFIFPGVSGVIIVIGLITLPRSRLHAYQLFRLAILITIFLTQVFSFYEQQLLALVGLFINVLILLALRYVIRHEKGKLEERTSSV